MVASDVQRDRPDGQQAAGEVRLLKTARQAKAQLDEWQRGVLLPLAQQDESTDMQQVGDQVVVSGGASDRQCLIAVFLGDCVAARLLKEFGRAGQGAGAQQRRPSGSR